MKKMYLACLFTIFTLNIYSKEIPKDIKSIITSEASTMYDSGRDRKEFIEWQEGSYLELEKSLKEADISFEEQNRIRAYLRGTYGGNFIKQNSEVEKEISRIKNTELVVQRNIEKEMIKKNEQEKIELESKNLESKKKLEKILLTDKIPSQLVVRFKSEAERLYPNNFYEQERYISSSMENFKFYKNLK